MIYKLVKGMKDKKLKELRVADNMIPRIISESDTPKVSPSNTYEWNEAIQKGLIKLNDKRTASCSSSYHSEQYNKGNGNCDVCGEEMPF